MVLLGLLAAYVIVSIIAGVASWLDYRDDEVRLLNLVKGPDVRGPPKLGKNALRWYETYAILFIRLFSGLTNGLVEFKIIPLIRQ